MTIQVTLTFGTPGEAAAALTLLAGGAAQAASLAPKPAETAALAATSQPATQEAKTPAPAASGTKATAGKAKTPAASPAPAPAEPAASTSLAGKSYPETGIGDLINGYLRKDAVKNRPTLVAALAALGGAKSGLEIKAEYYDAAHAAFKALNDGADPAAVLAGLSGDESMG
jgi:hypothetical protein